MKNKLLELRTKLIIGSIFAAAILFSLKACAFGCPFHIPEMEGGLEVTAEILSHQYEESLDNSKALEQYKKQRELEDLKRHEEMVNRIEKQEKAKC